MQKQTIISLALAVLALAAGALIYLAAPQNKPAAPSSRTNEASAPSQVGAVPSNVIIPPVPPVPTDQTRIPFNGQAPSVIGTVKSVTSSSLVLEITEQPKDKPGLVTHEQSVKLTNTTKYSFAQSSEGSGGGEAKRQDIKAGMTVTVFVKDAADLQGNAFAATSIEIRL